eukprot:TRINITY_DN62_c0_g2_i1.p1 TRINITY_DN62_c0_g2~~TRINITY_DN62_c0_g2_i1.p1  ORF type:complete len:1139 (+),score=268.25 TRINITY_DN62_c0_g2_i1:618-4034(+)
MPAIQNWFFVKAPYVKKMFKVDVHAGPKSSDKVKLEGNEEDLEIFESFLKELTFKDVSYPTTQAKIYDLFKSTPRPPECCLSFYKSPADSSGSDSEYTMLAIVGNGTTINMLDKRFLNAFTQTKKVFEIPCKDPNNFYISDGFKESGNKVSLEVSRSVLKIQMAANAFQVSYNTANQSTHPPKTELQIAYFTEHQKGKAAFKAAIDSANAAYVLTLGLNQQKSLDIFVPEESKNSWKQQESRITQSLDYFEKDFVSVFKGVKPEFSSKHADLLQKYATTLCEDFQVKFSKTPETGFAHKVTSLQLQVFGMRGPNWDVMKEYLEKVESLSQTFEKSSIEAQALKVSKAADEKKTKFLHPRVWSTVNPQCGDVTLTAIHPDDLQEALERLKIYVETALGHVLVEEIIELDSFDITRLVMFKPEVQAKLKELAKPCTVRYPTKVKIQLGLEISVRGKKLDCKPATKKIADYIEFLKRTIVKRDIKLEPHEFGCIGSKSWWESYKSMSDVDYEVRNDGKPIQEGFVAGLLREVTLKNGLKIQIRAGDIVRDTDVDALVCAADSFLQHGGGVAARICIAAGERFKSDCVSYIKQNAQVAETQAVAMNSGNLPNKYIINAVAPVYFSESGSGNTTEKLLATYRNIMSTAATMKIESIALPAVGAQLFRNPLNDVASALFNVLQEESQKPVPSVKLIRLVDIDQQVIDTFMALFDKSYNNQNVKKWKKRAIEKPIVAHPNYRWFWKDDKSLFAHYDEDSNWLIDQAYQLKQPEVTLSIPISLSKKGSVYKIIFQDMKQFNAASGFPRDVKKESFTPAPAAPEAKPSQPEKFEELNEEDAENSVGVQLSYMVTISHLSNEIQDAVDRFKKAIQTCLSMSGVSLDVPLTNKDFAPQVRAIMLGHCVKISKDPSSDDGRKIMISGDKDRILNAKVALYEAAQEIVKNELSFVKAFPSEWGKQEKNVALVPVANGCPEWQGVENRFRETVQAQRIISIERVQNKLIWSNFRHTIQVMTEADGKAPETKLLFHGTGKNTPSLVYDDPNNKGFTMQYCESGMWGRGTYFAQNASYSVGYSFAGTSGRQMFLAEVITGDHAALNPKSDLRMPPQKPNSAKRYTSVKGQTGGSDVFIVYDNGMAYPKYLITFQ